MGEGCAAQHGLPAPWGDLDRQRLGQDQDPRDAASSRLQTLQTPFLQLPFSLPSKQRGSAGASGGEEASPSHLEGAGTSFAVFQPVTHAWPGGGTQRFAQAHPGRSGEAW